ATAAAECEQALQLAVLADDIAAQARCYCLLADIFDRCADFTRAHDALAKAEALSCQGNDSGGRLAVLLMSCRLANWQNRYDDLHRYALGMLELSSACGDLGHEGTAANALGVVALYRFAVADAGRYFLRAVDAFRALNRPRNVIAAQLNQTLLFTRLGCLDDAIALGEATRKMADDANASLFREALDCVVAEPYLRKGDVERARTLASDALERSTASASRNRAPATLKLARCDAAQGDFEKALARIDQTMPLLALPGLEVQRCEALADRCWAALHLGRWEQARCSAHEFLPTLRADPTRFGEPESLFLTGARAFHAVDAPDQATAHLAAAWTIYRHRLAQIDERPVRERYASLCFHRDLVAAWKGRE
ncbi:MAG: hypothetical protein WBE77_04585, partial [Candidatus Cybelea sp.]